MNMNSNHHPKSTRNIRTACNRNIVISQKAISHLEAHPGVMMVLPEAIGRARLPAESFVEMEVDLGRVLGRASRVRTEPCDLTTQILFASRTGRDKPSRVAPMGSIGEETTSVVVIARQSRDDPQTYILVTAWLGKLARREPWDPMIKTEADYQDCLRFWCSNALIHDSEVMGEIFTSSWEEVIGLPRQFT